MAEAGIEIVNPRTGQRIRFVRTARDSAGTLLDLECVSPPSVEREPEHVHPHQENIFEVHSGKLHFRIDGRTRVRPLFGFVSARAAQVHVPLFIVRM